MLRQLPLNASTGTLRTFVFDHEVNLTSHSLEFSIDNNAQNVNLRPVIQAFEARRGNKEQYAYRVFDPTISQYVELPETFELGQHFFMTPIVMVKYRKTAMESDTESSSSVMSNDSRKERNKERTIREVIESVKRWRELHTTPSKDKGRVSLQEAAKIIGISKKSLDDYYYQLRLGEQYGFDFQTHMDSRIGVLRAFVRKHKPQKETNAMNNHPKELRIIEAMGMEPAVRSEVEAMNLESDKQADPEPVLSQMTAEEAADDRPIPYLDFNEGKIYDESEVRYYDNFMFDSGPQDPFVPYQSMDFKKKQQDFPDQFDMMPW